MRVLSDDDVASLLDLPDLLPEIERAFLKQGRGEVERPERPHFPVGTGLEGDEPLGTGLTMPAYVHGDEHYATKLASVHEGNADRGRPTVQAQIAVTDARTGVPAGLLAGTRITNARTGCIGGLAAKHLAVGDGPVRVGVVGAGTQARWQTRAIAAARGVESARVYSPSDSREACAADLRAEGIDAEAVDSARAAVSDADVVVTATTATEPVFPGDALAPGTLVVAVGAYTAEMRELDAATVSRAARLVADVPAEVAETGDFPDHGASAFTPLSAVFEGTAGRESDAEILVVASVGSAVLDATAATALFERAIAENVGTDVAL
ncbi:MULTISPECIES: ornithine cyclodeaminase family protein [Halolamina]|uniref:Alanine dehydrogenase n=1 Tax=Halolamina pelagica TaxID=699431 RepID=A0A1I5MGZ9_9EURY|nr:MULTISPECIES: ornithine cyclodeaminase family protein [Halolamina]NHX36021.1 ornithine cyclodeaminase family protein [Halolamina sp. R1-12]SFP08810.1 alanine dehydrogenase [Halolamina pelagica]